MDKDFKGINPINQDDLVVISIIIANFMVSKVLIDQGNSTDILYWKTFQRLEVSPYTIHPHASPLLGFAVERVKNRGYVDVMTTFSQGKLSKSFTIRYLLVDADTSYFSLIGKKTLNELGAIVSMPHLKMKFPTLSGEIVTVKANQKQAR
ncbi:hypothetical protein JHK82_031595 [Glycine max]|uniref:Uncharacterized protein n=1 Tax=Glycine max TaxID=3847 RepID=A0A0R0HI50_SOYBN|nr:hypothetical protein JHK87_031520 [Glycine soja]KAG4989265.1 hypothetical protein JHK85_032248 [Glycine max]KAG5124858.1 hypothetical protein JHK82_031595 [Glycine max]KAH1159753.1 hypothetical protein GYH30_031472 [Glycine max]